MQFIITIIELISSEIQNIKDGNMKTLETDRLVLREWSLNDISDHFEFAKNELVGPNAGWKPQKSEKDSIEIIEMFLKNDDVFAVELKEEKKVIGSLGLHKKTPDTSLDTYKQREIGYVLNPRYWGNGYIPEAVNRLVKFGFEEMNLDIIWCGHFEQNLKSKRVNEKCGFNFQFIKERTLENLDNIRVNTWYYNILRNEYFQH
jgi:RimJ/RimL family protein N-acetyltransferase